MDANETAVDRINDWIRDLFRLPYAKTTEPLELDHLSLTEVPDKLKDLPNLEVLSLDHNELSFIPNWLGALSKLRVLRFANNRIEAVPPEIAALRALEVLDLRANQLKVLPDRLAALSLKVLDLRDNPDLGIPESLLAEIRNPEEIIRYYIESRDGRPLRELKLLFVGRGQAGKTTLLKQLSRETPDPNEAETHSIAIRELLLECEKGKVRARAWDFGGQEILHATHQFFLSERSLYVLVLEPRTGMAQRDAEYWLKLIELQGRGSPVIVVLNKSRGRTWRVDEVKLRRKFPFVAEFISTDGLHGDGIDQLRLIIQQTVDGMRDVWLPFPNRWREIKDAVAGMRDNFLTFDQYTDLCVRHGERDNAAQADLASILHALGLALYFGRDPRLHDKRVLNPGWVTGGVYSVIRSPSVQRRDGRLFASDMPQVLREAAESGLSRVEDYPPDTHQFILDLMRAFQLCHTTDTIEHHEGRPVPYLVPELLPEFEPEMPEPWEDAPVRLRYRYETLQPGLLPRFIVRTHSLSDGAPQWRHGVVLRHADASALVRAETDRPELRAFVVGDDDETRMLLTTIVRRELDSLHAELHVQATEELHLSGAGDRWIGVKALREVESVDTPTQRLPVQPEGTAEVDVAHELDKLLPAEVRTIERQPNVAPTPVRLFVSYSRDDERTLKRLDAMLDVLEQHHGLTSWNDRRLVSGEEWDQEIRKRLEEMDIFLFIASQSALARPYIREVELQRARERHADRQIEVVTIKLEPCATDDHPFIGALQRLGARYTSVAEVSPRSLAWEEARKDLLPVIHRVRERRSVRKPH